jgi:hypothetical protein
MENVLFFSGDDFLRADAWQCSFRCSIVKVVVTNHVYIVMPDQTIVLVCHQIRARLERIVRKLVSVLAVFIIVSLFNQQLFDIGCLCLWQRMPRRHTVQP